MLQAPLYLCVLYFLPHLLLSIFLHSSGKRFLQPFLSWWEEQPVLVPSTMGRPGAGIGHWNGVRRELGGMMSITAVLPSPGPGHPPPVLGPDRVQGPWARLSPPPAPGPHGPLYTVTRAPKVPTKTQRCPTPRGPTADSLGWLYHLHASVSAGGAGMKDGYSR